MSKRFEGQVVLVTGSSRGIGRTTAEIFAEEGARVIVNYRSSEAQAEETVQGIRDADGQAWLVQADIGSVADIDRMVAEVEKEAGPVDVLVNNAAVINRDPFFDLTLEAFDNVWAANVRGVFYLSQKVARGMAERRKGAIINISSILAQQSVPTRVAYGTSKGALEAMTRAMALDLARFNVRVNTVSPGMIETEALLSAFPDPESQANVQRYVPQGRFGRTEELAQAVLFLASDAASYINGTILHVDAGLSVREAGPPS